MPPPGNAYLTLQSIAFQRRHGGGHNSREITLLCGDNPPEIVDGYGKWAVIDRPLRQGVTVPQGFNPAQVKCAVKFGIWDERFGFAGWDTSAQAAHQVEADIDDLHWMSGLKSLGGPSPIIYCDAYHVSKKLAYRTALMPPQFRGVGWVINGGITWGASLRRPSGEEAGSRVYQEAEFTLMGFSGQGIKPPAVKHNLGGGFFRVTHHINTAQSIASAPSTRTPHQLVIALAHDICRSPRNDPCSGSHGLRLRRKSITWKIPLGTKVWVPAHHI